MDYLGVDVGFGFTKSFDGETPVIFKSVMGDAADIQFQSGFSEGGQMENLHISVDGHEYFVGDMAEKQSNVREFTLDQNTLIEHSAKVMALTAISQYATNSRQEFSIVTGLPIRYYKQMRNRFQNILEGTHNVSVIVRGNEQKQMNLNIRKVRVLPQPFGSVFNILMNEHGRIIDRDLARDKFGVIDIGFRTTDYTITDRLRYIERGSRTTDTGISKAFSLISKKILEQSGISVELFRLFDPVREGQIKIRGKSFSLVELRDQVMKQLATAIVSDMERLWTDDWDLEFILLSGGGSKDLAPLLDKMIEGQTRVVSTEDDFRFANVMGYYKYAKYIDLMEKRRSMPGEESSDGMGDSDSVDDESPEESTEE